MKRTIMIIGVFILALAACKDQAKKESEANEMASEGPMTKEAVSEWQVLFDGSSMDQWKEYRKDGISEHWQIVDGAMVFTPPEERPDGEHYNLVTKSEFENFVLSLEWKISERGNSGVFWGIAELEAMGQPYETGPEIQVLDNDGHPDGKNGTTHQAGALYDMIAPSEDLTKPIGEWNTMEITVNYKAHMGSVTMNGKQIVSFPLGNEAWDAMVEDSKFKGWEGFGAYHKGKIGVQDHGDVVAYRNIKIKEL